MDLVPTKALLRRPRPSSAQIAEACARSAWLSHHYPEENAATAHGLNVDELVSVALDGGSEPPSTQIEACALVAWARREFPKDSRFHVKRKVVLLDPVTDEEITAGTPDLLVVYTTPQGRTRLVVVDWKTIGQFYSGHLAEPDDNLQQLIYMVAAGLELAVDEAQIILVCFDAAKLKVLEGQVHEPDAWWAFLDRIKAIPPIDMNGPQPIASKGEHCDRCWSKLHCSAYLAPAFDAEDVEIPNGLQPLVEGMGQRDLSEEGAQHALEWLVGAREVMKRAEKLTKIVESQLETYARTRGPIRLGDRVWGAQPTNGQRKGATVAELEARGLLDLIKPATPGEKFDWRKA